MRRLGSRSICPPVRRSAATVLVLAAILFGCTGAHCSSSTFKVVAGEYIMSHGLGDLVTPLVNGLLAGYLEEEVIESDEAGD